MATIRIVWETSLSGRVPYLVLTFNNGNVTKKRINSSTLTEACNFVTDKEAQSYYDSLN
jgi:hypothetical protein